MPTRGAHSREAFLDMVGHSKNVSVRRTGMLKARRQRKNVAEALSQCDMILWLEMILLSHDQQSMLVKSRTQILHHSRAPPRRAQIDS